LSLTVGENWGGKEVMDNNFSSSIMNLMILVLLEIKKAPMCIGALVKYDNN